MACPLFLPGSPHPGSAPGAPLGALFEGTCEAEPAAVIPEHLMRDGCNWGYARSQCPRAAEIEPDATRFLIKAHSEGIIEVAWSLERDHHPVAVGQLSLRETIPAATTLEQQARACASVYLRRKGVAW